MLTATPPASLSFTTLAEQVIAGYRVSFAEALAILQAPEEQVLDIMAAAYKIRQRYWGQGVQLYFLMNAKSGLCPEDCSYCSQSKVSEAEIPRYNILSREKLLDGARLAAERNSDASPQPSSHRRSAYDGRTAFESMTEWSRMPRLSRITYCAMQPWPFDMMKMSCSSLPWRRISP